MKLNIYKNIFLIIGLLMIINQVGVLTGFKTLINLHNYVCKNYQRKYYLFSENKI